MPQHHLPMPERDPAKLFQALAVEEPPEAPPWWPNDKQLVAVFQPADLESARRHLEANGR